MAFAPAFSLVELLQLLGVAQCVAGALYLAAQRGYDRRLIVVPVLYYAALGGHLLALYLGGLRPQAPLSLLFPAWIIQAMLPAVTALLVLQVARGRRPGDRAFLLLLAGLPELAPLALASADLQVCLTADLCPAMEPLSRVMHTIAGAAVLLGLQLWLGRTLFSDLSAQRQGRERYWLITTLVGLLTLTLAINLLGSVDAVAEDRATFASTVLALAFLYLVVTLLFRIYPSLDMASKADDPEGADVPSDATPVGKAAAPAALSAIDRELVERIERLLTMDKVYQDAGFDRASLARELGIPEHKLSYLVKVGFGLGVRQLLNDRRVAEAKQLLRDTDQAVGQICFDVGFNSLPSFNRVFKATTGQSPTDWRTENRANAANPPKEGRSAA